MKPNTTCHYCKKEIHKCPSHMKLFKQHFCDSKCQLTYQKSINKRESVKCSQCSKLLIRNQTQIKRSHSKNFFCDNLCKNRFLINKRWSGKQNVIHHHCRRENIFKKYDYSCVNCGYKENKKMLDIHHIDGNHGNNEYENLLSVCVWCHNLYHRCNTPIKNISECREKVNPPVLETGYQAGALPATPTSL